MSLPAPADVWEQHLRWVATGIADLVRIAYGLTPTVARAERLEASYGLLRKASSETARRLFGDPWTAAWVREGSELVRRRAPELLPDGPWRHHLRQLGGLALSAGLIEGWEVSARVGPSEPSACWLAGTGSELRPPPQAEAPIEVRLADGIFTAGQLRLEVREWPVVAGFRLAGWRGFQPTRGEGCMLVEGLRAERWKAPLEQARRLLEADPSSQELVEHMLHLLVPLQPASDPDVHRSLSTPALPGLVFAAWTNRAEVIAEALVHECDHQWLHLIEQLHGVFEGPRCLRPAVWYSPWRTDPRPLDGLLRGASAFARVGRFWTRVHGIQGEGRHGARACLTLLQAAEALSVVNAQPVLSEVGERLTSALSAQVRSDLARLEGREGWEQWRDEAQLSLAAHRAAWQGRYGRSPISSPGELPLDLPLPEDPSAGALVLGEIRLDLARPEAATVLLELDGARDIIAQGQAEVRAEGDLAALVLELDGAWVRGEVDAALRSATRLVERRPHWRFSWLRLATALRMAGETDIGTALALSTGPQLSALARRVQEHPAAWLDEVRLALQGC